MKVLLGADHAGFEQKEAIEAWLTVHGGYELEDVGTEEPKSDDDYPDYVAPMAYQISQNPEVRGIFFAGSGEGEAIVANRYKGVRAVVYYGGKPEIVKLSREHNDANLLSIGARFVTVDEAKEVIKEWLETPFSEDERHRRRIEKIDKLPS